MGVYVKGQGSPQFPQWDASRYILPRDSSERFAMTALDVVFRYGAAPGEAEIRAIAPMRDVYGIRKVSFDEKQRTVRVEYDASRLNEKIVAGLLRRAGIDLHDTVALA